MSNNSQIRGRSAGFLFAVAIVIMFGAGGCGDFFAEKSAELEADKTLRHLTRIDPVPEPNIPIPDIYKAPPKIIKQLVGGKEEWKLFYFCKYHTSSHLKNIVHAQFATPLFNKKQAATQADYTITANDATNQLIARTPTEDDINAILEVLESIDVPPIQVKIDCIISELYADVTMDRETTVLIQNVMGEGITMAGPYTTNNAGDTLTSVSPAFPGAALRDVARSKFGLKVGYSKGEWGHIFKALVDILESKGYLKILMNTTLEVVNGQTATIIAQETVPLQQVYLRDIRSEFIETRTEYVPIIDKLEITPHVFADGSIGLVTKAQIAAKSTPEGVKQVPVLTRREIDIRENRIRPGESLVIGGIRKSERRAVVRGVPGLKDIPFLGLLFSSRDFEERAKETIFIITPTISTGGIPNREMVAKLRREHEPPIPTATLNKAMSDPFGFEASKREQEKELLDAETARLEAAREKAIARSVMRAAEDKVQRSESEAAKAVIELNRVKAEALRIKGEADKAKADADVKLKAAQAAKAEADKATTDATQAKTDAQKLVQDAQKAKADAEAKAKAAEQALAQAEAKAKAAQDELAEAKKEQPKPEAPEQDGDKKEPAPGDAEENKAEDQSEPGSGDSKPSSEKSATEKTSEEQPRGDLDKSTPDAGKPAPQQYARCQR